jgi:23S rRNA pseudouridine2605 synthase
MSPDQPDVMPPDASATAPAIDSAADAPAPAKRPRAPRKTAGQAPAQADAVDDVSPAPANAGDAPQTEALVPAPRRRTRRAAAPEAAGDGSGDAGFRGAGVDAPAAGTQADAVFAPAAEPAAGPVQGKAVAAESGMGASNPGASGTGASAKGASGMAASGDSASGTGVSGDGVSGDSTAGSGVSGDGDGADGGGPGASSGASGEGESRRSRNRRRRRGRRAGAGEDEAAGAVSAEGGSEDGSEAGTDDEGEDEAGSSNARAPRAPRPVVEFVEDAGETFQGVLSGAFDADAEVIEGQPAIPAKRVLAAEPDAPKLHKVLAQSGIGSRRDMEQLIADGKVTVNGEVAHTGQRISFGDEVRVAGRVVKLRIAPPPARVIAYHKPAGEVVTMDDPEKRPTVFRRLPRLPHGKWQSVGRLDINTEGLLLFTNSGDLANKLMHPRFGVEREYAVRVLGTLDDEARRKLLEGVSIEGQPAQFKSIEDGGGEGANHWYRVVITEGRNREVRKLFDVVGLAVSRLIRIRYGSVVLPKGLKRGVWVDLDENDVRKLRHLAGAGTGTGTGTDTPRPQQPPDNRAEQRGPRNEPPTQRANAPSSKPRNGRGRDRGERNPSENPAPFREPGDPSFIPNPLQQTFDRRAIQQRERPVGADDFDEEGGPTGPIPNPLQQTYDKRFVQGNRSPFGSNKSKGGGGKATGGAPKQPDPLQTAVGYIGADAFIKKLHGRGGRGRR